MSMNQVVVEGLAGQDAECRNTASGKTVCKVRICLSEKFNDKVVSTWVDIEAWGSAGLELAKASKGAIVTVVGKLAVSEWEQDGKKRFKTFVNARKVIVAFKEGQQQAPAESAKQEPAARKAPAPAASESPMDDDNLPF